MLQQSVKTLDFEPFLFHSELIFDPPLDSIRVYRRLLIVNWLRLIGSIVDWDTMG
jgi:hypothetical protein